MNASLESKVASRTQELNDARIRAEEGARAKASFLANMSHEIRTPMHGMIGTLGLLSETPLSLEQKDYVDNY